MQAQNIAQVFERGEENRERVVNNLLKENRVTLSPAVQYAEDELSETSSRGG
jgi:predicted HTH domain antitoxin